MQFEVMPFQKFWHYCAFWLHFIVNLLNKMQKRIESEPQCAHFLKGINSSYLHYKFL